MRGRFFLLPLVGLAFLFLFGKLLLFIWLVAVIGGVLFFTSKGIRHFIREGRNHYHDRLPGVSDNWFEDHHKEVVPLLEPHRSPLSEGRIIPVN